VIKKKRNLIEQDIGTFKETNYKTRRIPIRLITTLALAITAFTELSSLGLYFMGTI